MCTDVKFARRVENPGERRARELIFFHGIRGAAGLGRGMDPGLREAVSAPREGNISFDQKEQALFSFWREMQIESGVNREPAVCNCRFIPEKTWFLKPGNFAKLDVKEKVYLFLLGTEGAHVCVCMSSASILIREAHEKRRHNSLKETISRTGSEPNHVAH